MAVLHHCIIELLCIPRNTVRFEEYPFIKKNAHEIMFDELEILYFLRHMNQYYGIYD